MKVNPKAEAMTYKKLQEYRDSFDTAITNIKSYLEPTKDEPQMHELALWMLETEHNPYGYLDQSCAYYTRTAEGFETLLHLIHHALYDDGDITFITVNQEPRLVLTCKYEDNFNNLVLHQIERDMQERHGTKYEVKVLDIKPNEFGALYDEYVRQRELKYAWVDELIESNNKKG